MNKIGNIKILILFGIICITFISCGKKDNEIGEQVISDIPVEVGDQLLNGDFEEAKFALLNKIQTGKATDTEKFDYIRANIGLLSKSMDTKNIAELENILKDILTQNPQSAEAYSLLGELQILNKSYSGAEKSLKKSIDLDNNYTESYLRLGKLYQLQNKFEESERYLSKAQNTSTDNDMLYFIMGENKYLQKDFDSAKKFFEAAIRATKNKLLAMKSYNNLAMIRLKNNEYEEAKKMLKIAIHYDKDNYLYHSNIGKVYLEEMKSKITKDNKLDQDLASSAINELTISIDLYKNHTFGYIYLGDLYTILGSNDAKVYYKKASEVVNKDSTISSNNKQNIISLINNK